MMKKQPTATQQKLIDSGAAALNHYGYAPQKLCDLHVNAVNITRHSLQYVAELFAFTLVHCHSSASAQL